MSLFDKLKEELSRVGTTESISGQEIHRNSLTNIRKKVDRPPLAISIGLDDKEYGMDKIRYPLRFGTYGNISLIKGHKKVRKSFAKSLLLACSIGGKANNYSDKIMGHDLQDKYIFDIDSEQGEYEVWLNANRIPKMVGAYPENYISVGLRKYSVDERRLYLEWLFNESEYRKKLGIVCLDGYVDFVKDFNNLEQSIEFTQKLMTYSQISKSHITGVLHLNHGSTKGRGHLGTVLEQKCETVVIIKDQGQYSEFTCQDARGKKFEEFTFSIDNDWMPYETDHQITQTTVDL